MLALAGVLTWFGGHRATKGFSELFGESNNSGTKDQENGEAIEQIPQQAASDDPEGYQYKITIDGVEQWEKAGVPELEYVAETEVRLRRKGFDLGIATLINIHDECSWKFGSSTEFVDRFDKRCSLRTRISNEYFANRFRSSKHIILVGLDSFPGNRYAQSFRSDRRDPKTETSWGPLAGDRAKSLADLVLVAYPQLEFDRSFWTLDLGKALIPSEAGTVAEARQRAAIIIGLRDLNPTTDVEMIIRQLVLGAEISGLELRRFERSEHALPSPFDPS